MYNLSGVSLDLKTFWVLRHNKSGIGVYIVPTMGVIKK